ncbi:hypothetical protein Mspyr1_52810 [Mycolicibacterium gilvum Spyr1]|uniref:TniQ domain-containing protein n=2 Tax=Mycolicibacterium gilvum TaxID=1804 RepID=E6TAV4_MYCSR|nr:hypothetical protein Mspyr1_52810 [Mycolicibacterium gilvum Spyr1]
MDLPLASLARMLQLSDGKRSSWHIWLSPSQRRAMGTATGTSAETIASMTLSDYDGRALRLDPVTRELDPRFPYGALRWSRYCPHCLSDSQDRWQIRWRLGWSFACLKHNVLLLDACPTCHARPRRRQTFRGLPEPGLCNCGYRLKDAPTTMMESDDPILDGQRTVAHVIARNAAGPALLQGASTRDTLEAIRSISNRVLNYASTHGMAAVAGVDLPAPLVTGGVQKPSRARGAINADPPARAIEAAVGVTAALNILAAPTVVEAGVRASWLIRGQNADTGPAELRSCSQDNGVATAVVIKASTERLGPELQLRYRSGSAVPSAPNLQLDDVTRIARALPRMMWATWSDQLLLGLPRTPEMRSVLSIATLLVGSSVRAVEAGDILGEAASANALNQRLWLLCGSRQWPSICARLICLSDYLNRYGAPIDYGRRRALNYSSLLRRGDWAMVCREAGLKLGHRPAATWARRFLVEKVSGGPATLAPVGRSTSNAHISAVDPAVLSALDGPLEDYAKRFLLRLGIDEPVEWSPPPQNCCHYGT